MPQAKEGALDDKQLRQNALDPLEFEPSIEVVNDDRMVIGELVGDTEFLPSCRPPFSAFPEQQPKRLIDSGARRREWLII